MHCKNPFKFHRERTDPVATSVRNVTRGLDCVGANKTTQRCQTPLIAVLGREVPACVYSNTCATWDQCERVTAQEHFSMQTYYLYGLNRLYSSHFSCFPF